MRELTITSKGQVTFRKDLLRHLGVGPGDKINVDVLPEGGLALHATRPSRSIESIFGLLAHPDNPVLTLDEIKTAIEDAWAGKR